MPSTPLLNVHQTCVSGAQAGTQNGRFETMSWRVGNASFVLHQKRSAFTEQSRTPTPLGSHQGSSFNEEGRSPQVQFAIIPRGHDIESRWAGCGGSWRRRGPSGWAGRGRGWGPPAGLSGSGGNKVAQLKLPVTRGEGGEWGSHPQYLYPINRRS